MADYDEYNESKQYTLFPCTHPTCANSKKWYKKLEQHYNCAHEGEQCCLENAIKERWRRRGQRMINKIMQSCSDMVSIKLICIFDHISLSQG